MLIDILSIGLIIVMIGALVALEVALAEYRLSTVAASAEEDSGAASEEVGAHVVQVADFVLANRITTFGLVILIALLGMDVWDRVTELMTPGLLSVTPARIVLFLMLSIPVLIVATGLGYAIPARLGERFPEETVKALAPLGRAITRALYPCIQIIRAMGVMVVPSSAQVIEEEELEEDIKTLVEEGEKAGVIEEEEKRIISRVFNLSDKSVVSFMTQRSDVVLLPGSTPAEAALAIAIESDFIWFPVTGESEDDIVGIVSIHDLVRYSRDKDAYPAGLTQLVSTPLQVPESMTALDLLELFKEQGRHFAIVRDEHGSFAGIATMDDVLKIIVGEVRESDGEDASIVARGDGSLLVDASSDVENLFEKLGLDGDLDKDRGTFHSVGGFVMTSLGHIPKEGDLFTYSGFTFEVIDMDGKRIDKVLVSLSGPKTAVGE